MEISDLETLQEKEEALQGKPISDYKQMLLGIGNYLKNAELSDLDDDYILEVEKVLKKLYEQAENEDCSQNLENGIEEAWFISAELSSTIKRYPGKSRDRYFFKAAKELMQVLFVTCDLI